MIISLIKKYYQSAILFVAFITLSTTLGFGQLALKDGSDIKSGSSREGNYILLHTASEFRKDTSMAGNTSYFIIERSEYSGDTSNRPSFKKVAEVRTVATKKQLQALYNEKEIAVLIGRYKLKNTEELMALLENDRNPNHHKSAYADIRFQIALGHTWLDEKIEMGVTYIYKVTRVDKNGSNSLFGYAVQTAKKENIGLIQFASIHNEAKTYTDTVLALRWDFSSNPILATKSTFKDPVLALGNRNESGLFEHWDNEFLRFRIYYTQNGILMPSLVTRGVRDSVIQVQGVIATRPDDEIMAWSIPEDIFGNQGVPSDTIFAFAVSHDKAPFLNAVYSENVVDGVRLSWTKVPNKPYIKGIKIQRYNDNVLEDVALLPITDTAFIDYNLKIGKIYNYQARILLASTVGFQQDIPAQVPASYKLFSKPVPPINLRAVQQEKNIRLDWDGAQVKGLYGYHVYRGYDGTEPTLLAGPITEATNYVDTSAELSGKSVYTYHVITENLRQELSLPSEPVHIKPNRAVKVFPPSTVQTYYANGRVNLTWDDARTMDSYITGFQVQRRVAKTGSYQNLGSVVTFAQTTDSTIAPGVVYEYRVASIGTNNEVSAYSEGTQFELPIEKDFSKITLSVRNTHKGVAINWPAIQRPAQTQFVLYRRLVTANEMEPLVKLPLGTSAYTDQSVTAGQSYVYAIALEFGKEGDGPLGTAVSIKHKPTEKPEILK